MEVIIVDEENVVGYYIEERGFITEDLIKKILKMLDDKKYELDKAIDYLKSSLEKAFWDVEDVKKLSSRQLKEYRETISLGIVFACEFLRDTFGKCSKCPLKHQCKHASFIQR
jgi:hypothetical protein